MMFELKIIMLLMAVSALQMTKTSNVSLLISLSLHQNSGPRTNWEKGYEILPGAHLAVNDINNDSTILCGHRLQLIIVDSRGDQFEIVQQFVNLTFHQKHMNIIGVSGILDPKAASILVPLARHKGVLLSAITYTDQLNIPDDSGALLSLPSPSATASTLLNFVREMSWQRIGLITDSRDAYFFNVAEVLVKTAVANDDISLSPYIELSHAASAVHGIIESNVKVIFMSVNARRAVQLLCVVNKKGLLWPEYAWIFHSFDIENLLEQQSACNIENVTNGIFLIDSQPWSDPLQEKLISGITFSSYYKRYLSSLSEIALEYNVPVRPNGYARLLYDLVWTVAIALNKSCHESDTCVYQADTEPTAARVLESHRGHNKWICKIFLLRKLQPLLVSAMHYNNSSITVASFNASILESAPRGELPVVILYPPLVYSLLLGLQIALMTIFVTLVLALYIYYRKEQEIKATSFTLSLLIFVGCYLNLLYLSLLFYMNHTLDSVNISRDNALCLSVKWLSGAGISLPLMLATLLVKMLRVYHIFHNANVRLSHYCSDLSLALYVLLILVPDVLVNLIWAFVDHYHVYIEYQMRDGYIFMDKTCKSKYETPLFGVLSMYLLILVLALTVTAIITRKVRMQHFKDTKKVNILLFMLCIGIIITFSFWILLQNMDTKQYIADLSLHIPHSLLVICFLSLLFVPKVFPPLWRHIKNIFSL